MNVASFRINILLSVWEFHILYFERLYLLLPIPPFLPSPSFHFSFPTLTHLPLFIPSFPMSPVCCLAGLGSDDSPGVMQLRVASIKKSSTSSPSNSLASGRISCLLSPFNTRLCRYGARAGLVFVVPSLSSLLACALLSGNILAVASIVNIYTHL